MLFRSRSGAPPRFLIFAGPYDSLIGKLLPNAAAYALALAVVFGLGMLGIDAVQSIFDPEHDTRRLKRAVTSEQASSGVLRDTGELWSRQPSYLTPICVVTHEWYQSGKNGGWREDWRRVFNHGADFFTSSGERLRISTDEISFAPSEPVVSDRIEEWSRGRTFREGRFREQCARHAERVFVEGCVAQGAIVPCSNNESVVITTGGGPQRRIDEAASSLMGRIGWGGVSSWLLVLWLARLVRARPLASALIESFSQPAAKDVWKLAGVIAAVPIVYVIGLWLVGWGAIPGSSANVSRAGHAFGLAVLAVHSITLIVIAQRRRRLAAAVRPIIDRPTVPLARADGGLVELAVRVHPRAPVHTGPLSDEPRAWWALLIDEEYGQGKSTAKQRVQELVSQPGVPVIDESGEGMLELQGAQLDVRAVGMSVRSSTRGADAQRIRPLLEHLPRSPRHVRFIVEERFVAQGEALYVLGHVERARAEQARAGYRQAPTTAVIRATGEAKLFVHAGSERSLLAGIRFEQRLASAMVWAIGGLAVLMAGAQMWLVTR